MLKFDKGNHAYTYDGQPVPSVTQVLQDCRLIDFTMVPEAALTDAAAFGTAVHLACDYFDLGQLDGESLNADVNKCLTQWIKFLADFKVEIIESEGQIYSSRYRYAGTFDRVVKINGRITLLDIKTGIKQKAHGVQTAAYSKAYHEMTGERVLDRAGVYLDADSYKFEPHRDKSDESVFMCALSIYNYKRK